MDWLEGVKAKGSCGLHDAGNEEQLLLSLPKLGSVCSTGGVPGCCAFSLPPAEGAKSEKPKEGSNWDALCYDYQHTRCYQMPKAFGLRAWAQDIVIQNLPRGFRVLVAGILVALIGYAEIHIFVSLWLLG